MAGDVFAMKTISRWVSLAEVALFYLFAEWVIWFGGRFRPTILVVAVIMIVICMASNRFHGDSRERIGFDNALFWPALKSALPYALPVMVPLLFLLLQRPNFTTWNWKFSFFGYPFWSFAQEYVVLGFMANRFEDGLPSHRRLIPWINGFLFSIAHLPNPILMTATFISGTLFTYLFFKKRNLLAYALLHALFGILITMAFGHIHGSMSVGTSYTRRLGNPYKIVDPRP